MVGRDAIWPLHKEPTSKDPCYSWRPGFFEAGAPCRPKGNALDPTNTGDWGPLAASAFRLPMLAGVAALLLIMAVVGHLALCGIWLARTRRFRSQGTVALGARWLRRPAPVLRLFFPKAALRGNADAARTAELRQEHRLALLASCAAVVCALVWSIAPLLEMLPTDSMPGGHLMRNALGGTRDVLVLTILVAAALTLLLAPVLYVRRHGPSELNRWLLLQRLLVGGAGLLAVFACSRAVTSGLPSGDLSAINAARLLSLGSLVSPTTPVLLFAACLYAWGLWNLRRLRGLALPFPADSAFLALVGSEDQRLSRGVVEELRSPSLAASRLGVGLIFGLLVIQAWLGLRYRHSVDGYWMGWFLWAGTLCLTGLMGSTLLHTQRLGQRLFGVLGALERHPVGSAFKRLPREAVGRGLSLRPVQPASLTPLVRQACALALAVEEERTSLQATGGGDRGYGGEERRLAPADEQATAGAVDKRASALGLQLHIRHSDLEVIAEAGSVRQHLAKLGRSQLPFYATGAWRSLERLGVQVIRALERRPWLRRPYPAPAELPTGVYREAETFVALQASYVIRHLVARLASGLSITMTGLVLILGAHLFYSFQGRQFWLAFDWLYIGLGAAVAVRLFVGLEKSPVLSRIWGTRPGRIDWTGGFIKEIGVYGALPVLTLVVTFFPEVANALFSWLEPVRKVLP